MQISLSANISASNLLLRTYSSASLCSNASTPATERSLSFEDNILSTDDRYILVVGGLGYIGSHTTWELLKEGYNVVIIDNLSNSYRSVLNRLNLLVNRHFQAKDQQRPSLEFYEADYRDLPTVRSILNEFTISSYSLFSDSSSNTLISRTSSNPPQLNSLIRGVINFAGYKAVSESLTNPLKYYSNNVAGLISFCSILNDFNIKTLIFSSSATVYGNTSYPNGRMREEYCVHSPTTYLSPSGSSDTIQAGCTALTNPYGRSKYMCEAILHDICASDPEWTVFALRYFNPVGCDASGLLAEDARNKPSNLMPMVAQVVASERECLKIYGADWETRDGTAVRDFIHVGDLASGHVRALERAFEVERLGEIERCERDHGKDHENEQRKENVKGKGFRAYNLGTGTGHSVREVISAMEEVSGRKIRVNEEERREGDVGICVAEVERARVELEWQAEKGLRECCEDVWRSIQSKEKEKDSEARGEDAVKIKVGSENTDGLSKAIEDERVQS
jgi:UDP-glucose 4-epimerase